VTRAGRPDALARAAIEGIESGMTVGLGTGRTANRAIRALAHRVAAESAAITCVATSHATEALARSLGLRIVPLTSVERVDVLVDGADEVDPALQMIKGRGGAMTEEKRVARAAARRIYVVQSSKLVDRLGETVPLPIEVKRSAIAFVRDAIAALDLTVELRRTVEGKEFRTDGGNPVLDAALPETDLRALVVALDATAGIVGHGLFLDEADLVLIEEEDGQVSRRSRG
jgi:ribose 5-phosphate isomerase A